MISHNKGPWPQGLRQTVGAVVSFMLSTSLLALPTLLPLALEKSCLQQPLDCDDIYAQGYQTDGVYLIYPSGPSVPVPVFCDMTTEGGKWTVSRWSQLCDPEPHL